MFSRFNSLTQLTRSYKENVCISLKISAVYTPGCRTLTG